MKKRLTKLLVGIFGCALLLTGCATVPNITNPNTEMIYTGGSTVTVGNHTYFANGYTAYSDANDFDYDGNSEISYLARINNDEVSFPNGKDFSPASVEKVNSKVMGYQNQDMFVLGNYIYYTSMNLHKDKNLKTDYSLVTFWRSKLNGDSVKELFTTEYFGEGAKFAPVGNKEQGYYWLCYTGTYSDEKDFSGQVYSIKLGNKTAKAKLVADEVSSVAFSDVNNDGSFNKILYTTTEEVGTTTENAIYSIDYSGENKVKYDSNGKSVKFVEKIRDVVFYTSDANSNVTFYRNIANLSANENFENGQDIFVYNSSISNLKIISEGDIDEGYVYMGSSTLNYVKLGQALERREPLATSEQCSNILFVEGDRVYFSNSTSVSRVSVKPSSATGQITIETLATLSSVQSGEFGYDDKYLYFFGGLEDVELEPEIDKDGNEIEVEKDSNIYMYRVAKSGGDYQLIGKTIKERTPKAEDNA